MADGTIQILGQGTSAVPLTYAISNADPVQLIAVKATFDGTAAGVDFVPMVEILSAAGQVMAFGKGASITAGDSATVTFAPFLEDETSGVTPTLTKDDVITALAPTLWWKLNELAGSSAADSTGNGWTGTPPGGFVAPTWGATVSPAGTTSADMLAGGISVLANGFFPSRSNNLTIMGLFNIPSAQVHPDGFAPLIYSGTLGGITTNSPGISIVANGSLNGFTYIVGSNAGTHGINSDSPTFTNDTWYWQTMTRTSGVWRAYVNGVQQAGTYTEGVYTPAGGGIGIGRQPTPGAGTFSDVLTSYVMVWGSRALTAAEILSIVTTPP